MTRGDPAPASLWNIVKRSARDYFARDTFTLGAALAFYTVFSIAPVLILVMAVAGLAFGPETIQGQIGTQIEGLIGKDGAHQVEAMIRGAALTNKSPWAAAGSGVVLLVGATSVFCQLRTSLNVIWGVKPKPGAGYVKLLLDRVFSFAMVVCLGFLLLVSLVIHAGLVGLSTFVERDLPSGALVALRFVEVAVSFGLTTLLFAIVYRFMSDARVRWRDAWAGAVFTAVLFVAGKYGIGTYLGQTGAADAYGVAGSVVVLLLWVYYSSQIVFLGAEFTQAFAAARGEDIVPGPYAVGEMHFDVEMPRQPAQGASDSDHGGDAKK